MAVTAKKYRLLHTIRLSGAADFEGWRDAARGAIAAEIPPDEICWTPAGGNEDDLFAAPSPDLPLPSAEKPLTVPRDFVERARRVICHSDPARFGFLYGLLWRLKDAPHLLKIHADPDVRRLEQMDKAIRRDVHKMRAFVRFVRIGDETEERFVSWFEPDHFIVELNAPFFVKRFTGMNWTILTPKGSAGWDGETLVIGPAARRQDAPANDATEDLWRVYFKSIFNPARLKVKAMQAEMPKKYWRNLPEASLIPEMVKTAGKAAETMIGKAPTLPPTSHDAVRARHWQGDEADAAEEAGTLDEMRKQASACRRCPLWADATQTVFGEGPGNARIVFVGEQPGDQEDLAGQPFVGPAGKVFDETLAEAGIDRDVTYVTNAVKHFKFEPRGKRRLHKKPNAGEIKACRWWLEGELEKIKPDVVVAMGGTALQSLMGKAVPVTTLRGTAVEREDGLKIFVTVHPSYLLRIPDEAAKAAERKRFLDDMKEVRKLMAA